MFWHCLKIGWRHLLRYRISAGIAVAGLAVGILCFVLCTYCARLLSGVDQEFPHHKRIAEVLIKERDGGYFSGSPASMVKVLGDKFPGKVECFTAVTYPWELNASFELEEGKRADYIVNWIEADTNFRKVFSCRLLAGNWEQIDRQKNAVVLSRTAARKIYGEGNPLGKLLHPHEFEELSVRKTLTDRELMDRAYVISGVMEDLPVNASFSFLKPVDLLFLNDEDGVLATQDPREGFTGCTTYALLRPGVNCSDINAEVDVRKHAVLLGSQGSVYLPEFCRAGQEYKKRYRPISRLYLGLGCLILWVALLNFFTFQTGNYFNRQKEYRIRKGLGADEKHLFWLLYTEILLYLIPVIVLVLCLLELVYGRLDFGWGRRIIIFRIDVLYKQMLEYLGCGLVVCALICRFASGWMSRKDIGGRLRTSPAVPGNPVRNILLGLQLLICCIFLTSSLVLYKQLSAMNDIFFPGLNRNEKEHILEVPLNAPQLKGRESFLIGKLSEFPEVAEVLQADFPLLNSRERGIAIEGQAYLEYRILRVGKNVLSFLKLPLWGGVLFQHPGQAIADPGIAGWMGDHPLGLQLKNEEREGFEISGLTAGYPWVYEEEKMGTVWTLSEHPAVCYLKIFAGTRRLVVQKVNRLLQEWVPVSVIPRLKTLQELIREETEFYNNLQVMLFFFAGICIVITVLGVYSAITIDTERRRKEMALRKIHGASAWQIAGFFVRLYAKLLGAAVLITFPLIRWTKQTWVEEFSVRYKDGIGFWSIVILLLTVVIVATIGWKIREIVRIRPVEVLRDE